MAPPTASGYFAEKLGTIKSAQNKELLIGLSGVINLVTFTEAKGQNGDGKVTSVADASVQGKVVLVPVDSNEVSTLYTFDSNMSSKLWFNSDSIVSLRKLCSKADPCAEESTAIVAAPGVVPFSSRKQTLAIDVDLTAEITDSDLEVLIDGYVEVGLELDTTAAHHFNFVAYDLASDVYDVYACWTGEAGGGVTGGEGAYEAVAAIKSRMLTVQAVRAVKTSDQDIDVGNGNLFRGRK